MNVNLFKIALLKRSIAASVNIFKIAYTIIRTLLLPALTSFTYLTKTPKPVETEEDIVEFYRPTTSKLMINIIP